MSDQKEQKRRKVQISGTSHGESDDGPAEDEQDEERSDA